MTRHHTLRNAFWLWIGIAAIMVLADQFTKVLIVNTYQLGEGFSVTSFFNIVRVHNEGAAFSFLANAGGWQRHPNQKLFGFGMAGILGGAVGNVIDRVLYGYVVDFLDVHYAGIHFPAFNIADSGISVGAALLILDEVLRVKRGR